MAKVVYKHTPAPLWLVAFSILLPTSFACLATSATNVAIPHISGYFGSTIDEANWIIPSYMIANSCLILMSGWLENLMGRKLFLKVFIGIFTLGSLICALAPNLNLMVLGRLIQGIGGGPMTPVSQSALIAFLLIPLAFLFNTEHKHKDCHKHKLIVLKQIPGDKI